MTALLLTIRVEYTKKQCAAHKLYSYHHINSAVFSYFWARCLCSISFTLDIKFNTRASHFQKREIISYYFRQGSRVHGVISRLSPPAPVEYLHEFSYAPSPRIFFSDNAVIRIPGALPCVYGRGGKTVNANADDAGGGEMRMNAERGRNERVEL